MRDERISTFEAACAAVDAAESDVIGDMGQEAWDSGYSDCVKAVAADCTPEVAADLLRRWGIEAD